MRTASACSARAAAASLEHFGLTAREVPALVGTLGKAFGSFGAFVAGDAGLIETLVQRARTYIYTTALPVAVAAATRAALAVSIAESWRRTRVAALTRRFRLLAAEAGLPLADSTTPIQPILIGDPDAAVAASARLLERGFFVAAIRPPTVPAGGSRLRVALSASHRDAGRRGSRRSARRVRPAPVSGARPPLLDRAAIRRYADRASARYDESAVLAARLREQMIQRLDWVAFTPEAVLDLGCGTGQSAAALAARWPRTRVIALDASPAMLEELARRDLPARIERLCAEAEAIPLPDASVDLVFSNLMLPWCEDIDAVFAEVARILKPQGSSPSRPSARTRSSNCASPGARQAAPRRRIRSPTCTISGTAWCAQGLPSPCSTSAAIRSRIRTLPPCCGTSRRQVPRAQSRIERAG